MVSASSETLRGEGLVVHIGRRCARISAPLMPAEKPADREGEAL